MFVRHCVDLVGDISQLAELSKGSMTKGAKLELENAKFELVK
jgi:hypothetical protein